MANPLVSVCLCTYHRKDGLSSCLQSLLSLEFAYIVEIIVVDNDKAGSAKSVVKQLEPVFKKNDMDLYYFIEPQQGVASARNQALSRGTGKYVAFIDDDETADPYWLKHLLDALKRYKSEGVFAPVLPVFPANFPAWQKSLFSRPRFSTGTALKGKTTGAGNVFFRRELLERRKGPFDTRLDRTGGEDADLFQWLLAQGAHFVWCDEAVVYENQPMSRAKLTWHLRRAYRGGWGFSFRKAQEKGFGKALLLVSVWVLPAVLKNLLRSLTVGDVRTIGLLWLKEITTQVGKLGFFLGKRVEEY